jgi:hypothetical protein
MAAGYEGVILPKKYYQQVGADGFAAKAIGSGRTLYDNNDRDLIRR